MTVSIYSVYDKKSRTFGELRFYASDLIAFRNMKAHIFDMCDKNKAFREEDFSIYRLGDICLEAEIGEDEDLSTLVNPITTLPFAKQLDEKKLKDEVMRGLQYGL